MLKDKHTAFFFFFFTNITLFYGKFIAWSIRGLMKFSGRGIRHNIVAYIANLVVVLDLINFLHLTVSFSPFAFPISVASASLDNSSGGHVMVILRDALYAMKMKHLFVQVNLQHTFLLPGLAHQQWVSFKMCVANSCKLYSFKEGRWPAKSICVDGYTIMISLSTHRHDTEMHKIQQDLQQERNAKERAQREKESLEGESYVLKQELEVMFQLSCKITSYKKLKCKWDKGCNLRNIEETF